MGWIVSDPEPWSISAEIRSDSFSWVGADSEEGGWVGIEKGGLSPPVAFIWRRQWRSVAEKGTASCAVRRGREAV